MDGASDGIGGWKTHIKKVFFSGKTVQIKILKVRKFLIFTTKIFLLLKLNLNYIDVRWFIFKYNVPVIDMNNILLYVVHSLSLKNQLD